MRAEPSLRFSTSRRGVSERRAGQVLGPARATQRYAPAPAEAEERLEARVIEWASQYGRYGYLVLPPSSRRITALLRGEGWPVNHKHVEWVWRREGFTVPPRQP